MAHFKKAEPIATNTLLIPDIPLPFFFCDEAMLAIHDAFAAFGPLYSFVKMKGFRRLMIIYQETLHALKAKKELTHTTALIWRDITPVPDILNLIQLEDPLEEEEWINHGFSVFKLKVYYGQHFTIHVDPDTVNLQVPQFQRNLLISPPGSPFEGWEQIEEDAPNQKVLASDLMHAADMSDFELDDDVLDLSSPTASKNDGMDEQEDSAEEAGSTAAIASLPSDSSKTSLKTVSIVCAKGSETPDHLPSITVQDWDGQDDQLDIDESMNIRKKKLSRINKMVPTAMPPTTSSVFEQSS